MSRRYAKSTNVMPDGVLVFVTLVLMCGGLVMLTSASVAVSESLAGSPFYFLRQQLVAVLVGALAGAVMLKVPTEYWEKFGAGLVVIAFLLLIAVLIPGVGRTVNGATRWVNLGVLNVQVSEPARLLIMMYLAGYAVRFQDEIRNTAGGFIKPIVLVGAACALLLLQPDFGAATVLLAVTLGILFVAGARLIYFFACCAGVAGLLALLAITSPYRLKRITGFMDPWADPYNNGFQLVQSLIAIGSGDIFGLGLGNSVQKLFYLPEAHTDFVFAVIAEEFGLVGSLMVIVLFGVLVWRALLIARHSAVLNRYYQAYLSFGIAIWLGMQSIVNMGVNMGVFPTKGLTLPLISYGRSSLIITMMAVALLIRIDIENGGPAARAAKAGSKKLRGARK